MEFNYYYGSQADQFSFIRIPRVMLTEEVFSEVSLHAKVLYAVLLDRMSLSRKNGWLDDENRVFIIYQIGEIQEDLGFTRRKAMELLSELEKFGLLEKKRRGHGLPNILYVKSFMTGIATGKGAPHLGGSAALPAADSDDRGTGTDTGSTAKISRKSRSTRPSTSGRPFPNATLLNTPTSDVLPTGDRGEEICTSAPKKTPSRSTEICTQEVQDPVLQEVQICTLQEVQNTAPLKNKTEINKTEKNHIKSNHISGVIMQSHGNDAGNQDPEMRSDEKRSDNSDCNLAEEYRGLIIDNLSFGELLKAHPYDHELLWGILDLILETVLSRNEYTLIASDMYPTELVRNKFLKLGYWHIEYVLNSLDANTTKVRNIKKYLLAALFNAPSTIEGYYKTKINYDMPEFARQH